MDRLFKYYGADWAGMILILFAIYYMGQQRRRGFVFGMLGSAAWLVFGFMTDSVASVLANTTYVAMNARGYMKWRPAATQPDRAS